MNMPSLTRLIAICAFACLCGTAARAATEVPEHVPAAAIPRDHLLQPAQVARMLTAAGGEKPLLLQVGSHVLYAQAHIPGSEYVGAAGQDAGLEALQARAQGLDHAQHIVIYCGCCPWSRCPNIGRAYRKLAAMGFTHVDAMYMADDFGADWVDKGYPVATGG